MPPLPLEDRSGRSAASAASGAALAALVCVVVLLATSPWLPMAWDEGNATVRSEGIGRWVGRWLRPSRETEAGPLSRRTIAADWQYTTQVEGHPAFYGIVIAAGRAAAHAFLRPLESARSGPIVLFSLACGAMFYRLARQYSMLAAAAAVGALLLLPRVFAHAHFASCDGPLLSGWILAWATFAGACRRWPYALLWGVMLGITLSTKAPGWFAPIPFVAWAMVYRDRGALRALAMGLPVAVLVFYLFNPPLWHDPLEGLATFFSLNWNRPQWNISVLFLGRMHNLDWPLPWYNTLFWTAITVPVGLLGLFLLGLATACRRWRSEPYGMLLVFHWLVLVVVRAIPGTPPHDGVRLFLPSFAFLAALIGVGADRLLAAGRSAPRCGRRRLAGRAAVLGAYLGAATSLAWYAPQWLSYYNLAIGGLPGATAAGMEPTYYWDALDRRVIDWLDRRTAPGEKVQFAAGSVENLELMRRWGELPFEFRQHAAGRWRWYVVQHRPSAWQAADRWLVENATPAFSKSIRRGGWGPWRLDQPLISVYGQRQYEKAVEAIHSAGSEPRGG